VSLLRSFRAALAKLRTKQAQPSYPLPSGGGWFPVVREPYPGAWQQNIEYRVADVLAYGPVFACVTLISQDIGKLTLNLVSQDADGIWSPVENPAFSPVLRKPNRYQVRPKFIEEWIKSKLVWGNSYVLKERDQRGIVIALYVLDPQRVRPLVAPDGAVYYELQRDDLAQVRTALTVPASEIIHDRMVTLYHPLIGMTPLYAAALAAMQGLAIQGNSTRLFQNGAAPGGILVAPGAIDEDAAKRVKDYWEANYTGANVGKVAVLGDGMKYEATTINAVDAELIQQLKWTGEDICTCYHVPAYMVGIGNPPPYANIEPLLQQYYSQCVQSLLANCEACLDEGLGLLARISGTLYGTEFDIDDLVWMDTATKTKAAADAIGSGAMSPNEARKKYFGLGPVDGGDTPYMQQQMFSLAALAERDADAPFAKPQPAAAPTPANQSLDQPTDPPPADATKSYAMRYLARVRALTHAA